MDLTESEKAELLTIAMNNIVAMQMRGDFDYRWNDAEDYFEVSVGSLESALEDAYCLGKSRSVHPLVSEVISK